MPTATTRPCGRAAHTPSIMHDCAPVASSTKSKPSFACTRPPSDAFNALAVRAASSPSDSSGRRASGLKVDVAQKSLANANFSSTKSDMTTEDAP